MGENELISKDLEDQMPKRAAIRERNQGGNKSFGGWKLQQLWGGFAAAWWPNLGLGKQQELDFNPPFQPAVVKEEKGEERAAKLLVVRKKNPRERGGEKPRENQEKKLEKAKGGYGRAGVRKKGVKNFGAIWRARAECLESQNGGRFRFAYPNPSLGLAKVSYLPAIPDTRLWKDGAADCFSMYGNELPRIVLIRIRSEYDTQRCPSKFELITGHSSFKQVSNLPAIVDARWRGEAWRTVNRGKC
ncbi:hypothetical protein TIFTF001_033716 [Ficus carica]|uniref:Uncharacterized protein n=1 Tax=Ficus carica TaxID=3494 RepID=A0AA88E2I2_FICCA|nr:hypothetical protein TIFTF001_033716 [Ficus carica]